jgi:hypothetical protein
MSSSQIALQHRRIPISLVGGVSAATFAIGVLTGFGVPRILGGEGIVTGPPTVVQAVPVLAGQDMSDAAYGALHGVASTAVPAGRSMSDAAYEALHRHAERTMSDAAYEAIHASTAP